MWTNVENRKSLALARILAALRIYLWTSVLQVGQGSSQTHSIPDLLMYTCFLQYAFNLHFSKRTFTCWPGTPTYERLLKRVLEECDDFGNIASHWIGVNISCNSIFQINMCVFVFKVFRTWKWGHKYVSVPVYKSDLSCSLISSPKVPAHPVICGQHDENEIRMQLFKCQMFPTLAVGRKDQLIFSQPLKKFHAL
jgi:hypothetical protein